MDIRTFELYPPRTLRRDPCCISGISGTTSRVFGLTSGMTQALRAQPDAQSIRVICTCARWSL